MDRQSKTKANSFGSKTNFTGGEISPISVSDHNNDLESVQSIIAGMMRTGKTIREHAQALLAKPGGRS